MIENRIVRKHAARLATIDDHEPWVRTKARELNLENEMDIAWALNKIMFNFQDVYDFAGVSSNNIIWEMTHVPVRMLCIPLGNEFVVIINPKYEKLAGQAVNSKERCGSIPKRTFIVKRRSYVVISGYDIDGEYMELEYGSKSKASPDCHSWVIQHEMDHLDGVLIMDKAIH